jgi:CheY-like chemotaxis protein
VRRSALEIEEPGPEKWNVAEFQAGDEGPRMLADHCARLGFNVETSTNGVQTLLKANRFKPNILVVDVNMPEVDGLTVCEHLLSPDRALLNVIVITGSRHPDTLERCEGFGAYYARKGPKFWEDLEAALAEIDPGTAARSHRTDTPAPEVRKRHACC